MRCLGIDGPGDVIDAGELEERGLVLEGGEDQGLDLGRPVVGETFDEARANGLAVTAELDLEEHRIDAIERRTTVHADHECHFDSFST